MGYNISIGEAYIDASAADGTVDIQVEDVKLDDAPCYDSYIGKGNRYFTTYAGFHDFTERSGLKELFFGVDEDGTYSGGHREYGLMAKHAGHVLLLPADLAIIRGAIEVRKASNGGKEPGLWDESGVDNGKDWLLARLLWLEFWVAWALEHCRVPVLKNS